MNWLHELSRGTCLAMPTTREQLRSQARGVGAAAAGVLGSDLPLSGGELAYLVGVVELIDEFLGDATPF